MKNSHVMKEEKRFSLALSKRCWRANYLPNLFRDQTPLKARCCSRKPAPRLRLKPIDHTTLFWVAALAPIRTPRSRARERSVKGSLRAKTHHPPPSTSPSPTPTPSTAIWEPKPSPEASSHRPRPPTTSGRKPHVARLILPRPVAAKGLNLTFSRRAAASAGHRARISIERHRQAIPLARKKTALCSRRRRQRFRWRPKRSSRCRVG
jgi:hypothetical protein